MINRGSGELLCVQGDLVGATVVNLVFGVERRVPLGVCFSTRSAPSGPRGFGDPVLIWNVSI